MTAPPPTSSGSMRDRPVGPAGAATVPAGPAAVVAPASASRVLRTRERAATTNCGVSDAPYSTRMNPTTTGSGFPWCISGNSAARLVPAASIAVIATA